MIRMCAWHRQYFGKPLVLGEVPPFDDNSITHGICKECAAKVNAEIEQDQAANRPIDKCWTVKL